MVDAKEFLEKKLIEEEKKLPLLFALGFGSMLSRHKYADSSKKCDIIRNLLSDLEDGK